MSQDLTLLSDPFQVCRDYSAKKSNNCQFVSLTWVYNLLFSFSSVKIITSAPLHTIRSPLLHADFTVPVTLINKYEGEEWQNNEKVIVVNVNINAYFIALLFLLIA